METVFSVFAMVVSKEVLAAVVGGSLALLLPSRSPRTRSSTLRVRRRFSLPPCWHVTLFASCLVGFGVHATKAMVRSGLNIKLHRQEIPLYSAGGSVHHKSAYYGAIQVGGPESQPFNVVFDTGSGHLVLPSTLCKSQTCKNHRRYKRKASLVSEDIDVDGTLVDAYQARDQISVKFGTGDIHGIFVRDQVCLGSDAVFPSPLGEMASALLQRPKIPKPSKSTVIDYENVTVEQADPVPISLAEQWRQTLRPQRRAGCMDMRLVASTEMTDDPFSSFVFDGIFGLGLTGLSQTPEYNLLDMLPNGLPGTEQIFSVFLANTDAEDSEISFGTWEQNRLLHPENGIQWTDVQEAQYGYWQINILGITAGGVKLDFCNSGCRAVVDTGTSLIGAPAQAARELRKMLRHEGLQDADGQGVSCGGPGPQLIFDLGNFSLTLDPLDIARPQLPSRRNSTSSGSSSSSAPPRPLGCLPMLMNLDLPEPLSPKTFVLGEPFLQRYYTVFDRGSARVGFGEAKHVAPRPPRRSQDTKLVA